MLAGSFFSALQPVNNTRNWSGTRTLALLFRLSATTKDEAVIKSETFAPGIRRIIKIPKGKISANSDMVFQIFYDFMSMTFTLLTAVRHS